VILLRFEPHCKICRSWLAPVLLYLHHYEGLSYKQLIERYKHVLDINEYNLSTHFNRHVQQKDIDEVEETERRWKQAEAELSACT
jgi:hypothetical protein